MPDDARCQITQACRVTTVQLQVIDVFHYYTQTRVACDQLDLRILI